MARLELFTNSFPFGSEFVEGEIKYLARVFDSIIIIPARLKSAQIVSLPVNVKVDTSLADIITPCFPVKRFRPFVRLLVRIPRLIRAVGNNWPEESRIKRNGTPKCWYKQVMISISDSYAVREWARERDPPDIAYTYWLGPTALGLRSIWQSAFIMSRAHGYDIYAEQSGLLDLPFHDRIVSACDKIYSVSQHGERYLRSHFEDTQSKYFTEPLGIDDLGGLALPPLPGGVRVLSVSSVDSNKRVDRIANVIDYIAAKGQQVFWTHAGSGPEMTNLCATVQRIHRNAKVTLLGQVSKNDIRELLLNGRFNVFINQSVSEGCPVSIMEAQCVGLATVATDSGGTSEVMMADGNVLHSIDAPIREVAEHVIQASQYNKHQALNRRACWAEYYNSEVNYSRFADKLRSMAA